MEIVPNLAETLILNEKFCNKWLNINFFSPNSAKIYKIVLFFAQWRCPCLEIKKASYYCFTYSCVLKKHSSQQFGRIFYIFWSKRPCLEKDFFYVQKGV